jgi:ferric-dicitrate binding protein FerR (iron transport regulator)
MKINSEILKKYANQQCSNDEQKIVEQWIKSTNHADDKEELPTTLSKEKELWNNIKNATDIETKKEKHTLKRVSTWAIAATITLLIAVGGFQSFFNTTTYKTIAGQTELITLKDGSIVHLNANSILTISKDFSKNNRAVHFIGEGYFEVAKDSLHPFVITTEKTQTTVLGTKFNLYAYPQETNVLTLDEGKVSFSDVKNLKNSLILLPNEQAILSDHLFKNTNINTKYYKGWLTNKLYFNNESLLTIARKIERTYGVKINITNPKLKAQTYKGVYNAIPLETLLEDLSFVLKFNYTHNEKEITIY